MGKLFTLCLSLCLAGTLMHAQTLPPFDRNPEDGTVRCATEQHEAWLQAQFPGRESSEEFEVWLQNKMAERERNPNLVQRSVVTLPVVVHVLHTGQPVGTGINISAAQVQSQIDALNEDFRRTPGTAGFNNHPDGADCEIEFCLAYLDTAGAPMAEPGINRVDLRTLGITNNPPFSIQFINTNIKPQTFWDPTQYLNIWVVSISNGILGFAQTPSASGLPGMPPSGGPAATDGVVIAPIYFGRTGSASFPYNLGRTATHEIGHYLGLRHIWGDGDCSADDFCTDTPNADDANYGCPSNNISCGSRDMVENYMDYSNDACFNIFTNCQKSRMLAVLANSPRRRELLNSTVCLAPTSPPVANFVVEDTFSCNGTFQFIDSSINIPTFWFWNFGDGNTSTDRNPVHTYAASGSYNVTLVANNPLGSNAVTRQVNVVVGTPPVMNAGTLLNTCFGDTVQLDAQPSDPTASIQWSPGVALSNPRVANPTFLAITSRTYYITATDSLGCSNTDTLVIVVNPNPVVNAGPDLLLAPPDTAVQLQASGNNIVTWDWSPTYGLITPSDIPNPIAAPQQTVTYTVIGISANGCQDEDQITVTVEGTPPLSVDFESYIGLVNRPFPSPAMEQVTFSAHFLQGGELALSLYDLSGKRLEQLYAGPVRAELFTLSWQRPAHLSAGLYLVAWEMGGARYTQKLVLGSR